MKFIAEKVVDAAFTVYKVKVLELGLLESVYEVCFFITFVA